MPVPATPSPPGRSTHLAVLALTVVVFAAAVAFVTLSLRSGLRDQIMRREAESFAAVASMQLESSVEELAPLGIADAPGGLLNAVLKAAKQAAKLGGIVAVRVFDGEGKLAGVVAAESAQWAWSEEPPTGDDWGELKAGRVVARLHARESRWPLAADRTDRRDEVPGVPLLEAWVPVRRANPATLAGVAQFWSDGEAVAGEFRALDRRLIPQAALAWLAGTLVMVAALSWAFRRLAAANRALLLRGEDLQRANRELVLAAKTSALGAVTAHLFHELKNPLAGLEIFVANQSETGARPGDGAELAAASELTRRLRSMVNDVVGVLRDEQSGAHFELTCAELAGVVLAKARPEAERRGVKLESLATADVSLPGRQANLAGLVLGNLVQNALEAVPAGGVVRITGRATAERGVEFLVEDNGPGLPDAIRSRLFQPCASAKAGGSGLGLALSNQLAQQARGRLELVRSDQGGTCFRLVLAPEA